MIDASTARNTAEEHLAETSKHVGFGLEISGAEEHELGFIFFYNSGDFLRTGDPLSRLAGNGPLLIDRNSGELVIFPTHQPLEASLAEYAARSRD